MYRRKHETQEGGQDTRLAGGQVKERRSYTVYVQKYEFASSINMRPVMTGCRLTGVANFLRFTALGNPNSGYTLRSLRNFT
jgi:hypothetical protein